jgi:hypothetical protein
LPHVGIPQGHPTGQPLLNGGHEFQNGFSAAASICEDLVFRRMSPLGSQLLASTKALWLWTDVSALNMGDRCAVSLLVARVDSFSQSCTKVFWSHLIVLIEVGIC